MTVRRLAIVGPTASGKSSLALSLAQRLPGVELVSVDSMQVYRGMDIGTAKPTPAEQASVPHHMIDLLDPSENCSVGWFRNQALNVLADLDRRGATPVFVGGTGLYLRGIVDGLELPGQWPDVAADLEAESDTDRLFARLAALDPLAASRMEPTNRRRIVRALEVTIGSGRPFSSFGPGLESYSDSDVVMVGLAVERDALDHQIRSRLVTQMSEGFLDEVCRIETSGVWSRTAAQALGYRELLGHLRDGIPLAECVELTAVRTRKFAVRQQRWFRRDPRITWFDFDRPDLVDAVERHWRNQCR